MQFLEGKEIPKELRNKIRRFLDYNFEMKKDIKIEEHEVMELLNDDLKGKITVYLNGKILKSVDVFSEFPLEFLSNLTFIFKKRSFVFDEYVLNEGEDGKELFFITSGKVSLLHKQSYSYILDLEKDRSFGEIAFFSEN